jgi:predicted peroxiredoxin
MENLVDYKKKIVSRFIPIEGGNISTDLPDSDEYYYAEKIDGNLGLAVVADGKVTFFNRSGVSLSLPHLESAFPSDCSGIWAGELYTSKDRSRFFEVASAIANDKEKLHFAVFDAVHLLDKPTIERIKAVQERIPVTELIHSITWVKATAKKEVVEKYKETIEQGKEGLVIHTSIGATYKLKPSLTLDLTVLGHSMKEDGTAIRALLVGLYDKDQWIVVASVGGGFSEEDRIAWVQKLEPLECNSDFVMVANNRLAYKWVKPTIVIQVKCIEIINEDSSGTIYKDNVTYQEGIGYESHGKVPAASIISPVMMGVREDKTPGAEDTGINQITSRVEILQDEKPDLEELPQGSILFRHVYTKNAKTGTAVRKFVGVKTNKTLLQGFPPYYLYLTDFSAGRKDPLQTDIKIATTEDQLKSLLDKAIEENVKKGWDKIYGGV